MPFAAALPVISAGLQAAGMGLDYGQSRANMRRQEETNRQNREWDLRMYFQNRMDNLKDWNRTNNYNSPQQQMQRLKEAGLNPHLMYGTGASGMTAQPIRGTNSNTPNVQSPQMSVDYSKGSDIISAYQNAQVQQLQTDNLKLQADLLVSKKLNTDAQTVNTLKATEKTDFDLNQSRDLKDLVVDKFKLENSRTAAQIDDIKKQQEFKSQDLDIKHAELIIKQNEYKLKAAKTEADIRRVNEDILRSMVLRQATIEKLPIEKEHLEAAIQKVMTDAQYSALRYRLEELKLIEGTPEYYKRYADLVMPFIKSTIEAVKVYSQSKSIPFRKFKP